MIEVEKDVYAVSDPSYPVNAYFVVTAAGVVVIDALAGPEGGRALIGAVESVTDVPIRYLINTHEHWDHIFGNEVFAEIPGCLIIGHDDVRAEILRGPVIYTPTNRHRLQGVRLTPPHLTFSTRVELHLGGEPLVLTVLGGHSPGSAVVWLPHRQVLCCGDLVTGRFPPVMATSSLRQWVTALDHLETLGARTVLPGHGSVQAPESIRRMREWVDEVRHKAETWIRQDLPPAEVVERVMADRDLPDFHRDGLLNAVRTWAAEATVI